MKLGLRAGLLSLLLTSSLSLYANDTFVTLNAGGTVPKKTTAIVVESEDLTISAHPVRVRYVFPKHYGS